jgi:signal transduction histidine kinase
MTTQTSKMMNTSSLPATTKDTSLAPIRWGIQFRLTAFVVLAMILLGFGLGFITNLQQSSALIDATRDRSLTLIGSVNNTIDAVSDFINDISDIAELDARLTGLVEQNDNVTFIAVGYPDGNVIFHSNAQLNGALIPALSNLPDNTIRRVVSGFGDVYVTHRLFENQNLAVPTYQITIGVPAEVVGEAVLRTRRTTIGITVLAVVIVATIVSIAFRLNVVRPILDLTDTARSLANGDLSKRAHIQRNDEIGVLGQSFNTMSDQLLELVDTLEHRVEDRTRELAVARDEAERANRVKSQFLASMSHELRTPLNGVLNFTQFVSSGMMGTVNEKQVGYLNQVIDNANHLLSLINDVLDISKIESGSLKLFLDEDVDLQAILRDVANTGQGLKQDSVTIVEFIPEDLPTLLADERRVRQIFLNIVSNACKFTDEGSITIKAESEGDNVLVSVSDTGIGIGADEQANVFESFTQTRSGFNTGGGTGLGMPISKKLAEEHGGTMWFESVADEGTTFYVRLPLRAITASTTLADEEKTA